jgi:hypothetical protein
VAESLSVAIKLPVASVEITFLWGNEMTCVGRSAGFVQPPLIFEYASDAEKFQERTWL